MKVLTQEILVGFDNYKYCAVDTNPLSKYILHPFWDWFVQFYPQWLAPNVLTLSGFLLQVLMLLVASYYDPYLLSGHPQYANEYPPLPDWMWLFCAACLFSAHLLDGTDGKQARRIGASGPLGELFDHGLDSWAAFYMPMTLFSIFGRDTSGITVYRLFYVFIGVQFCFVLSHWEKYNTGVLYLPWSYDGSQIFMCLSYVLTFFLGQSFWHRPVPTLNIPLAVVLEIGMYASYVMSLSVSVTNVILSYVRKTGHMRSFYEALVPMFPLMSLFTFSFVWALRSPSQILEAHPKVFMYMMGTIFANMTCRLIISQMSNTRAATWHWLLAPLALIDAIILTGPTGLGVHGLLFPAERLVLFALAAVATIAHVHFGFCVVSEMAEHLGIFAFRVKRKASPKTNKRNGNANHVVKPSKQH